MPIDILTRAEKGTRLEQAELDQNLIDLQDGVNAARGETVDTSTDLTLSTLRIVFVDAALGLINITLPAVATNKDKEFIIKKIDSSGNAVNILTDNNDVIEGTTQLTLNTQWDTRRVVSNGTFWYVI